MRTLLVVGLLMVLPSLCQSLEESTPTQCQTVSYLNADHEVCVSVSNHGCDYLTGYLSVDGQPNATGNITREEFDQAKSSTRRICRDATDLGAAGCQACVDISAVDWTEQAISGCPRAQLWCGPFKVYDRPLGDCLNFQNCNVSQPPPACPHNCSYPAGRCLDDGRCRCVDDAHFDSDCSAVFDPDTSCVTSPKLLGLPLCLAVDFVSCDEAVVQVTLGGVSVIDDTFNTSAPTQHCTVVQNDCQLCLTTLVTSTDVEPGSGRRTARICNAVNSSCLGSSNYTCSLHDLTSVCPPSCPGACSGHGQCSTAGTCQCQPGYAGSDCSYHAQDTCLLGAGYPSPQCALVTADATVNCSLLRVHLVDNVTAVPSPAAADRRYADVAIDDLLDGRAVTLCWANDTSCPLCTRLSAQWTVVGSSLRLAWTVQSACAAGYTFDMAPIDYTVPAECDDSQCAVDAALPLTDAPQRLLIASTHRVFAVRVVNASAAALRLVFDDDSTSLQHLELFYAVDCQPRPSNQLPLHVVDAHQRSFFDRCPTNGTDLHEIFLALHCLQPPCSVSFRTALTDVVDLDTSAAWRAVLSPPFVQLLRVEQPFAAAAAAAAADSRRLVVTVGEIDASLPLPELRTSAGTCPDPALPPLQPARIVDGGRTAVYVLHGSATAAPTYLRIEQACQPDDDGRCGNASLRLVATVAAPRSGSASAVYIVVGVVAAVAVLLVVPIYFYFSRRSNAATAAAQAYSRLDVEVDSEQDADEN